jgi:hypothetical protein
LNDKIKINKTKILRLINGIISEIFDPNLFFSRLSFLESGKEALDIKVSLKVPRLQDGKISKLPNIY